VCGLDFSLAVAFFECTAVDARREFEAVRAAPVITERFVLSR